MMKTATVVLTAVLMAGLTASCGQSATTADDSAEAAEQQAIGENANETADAAPIPASAEATTETATPRPDAGEATSQTTTSLPLRHGYYVRSDTPCNRASRADIVALVSNTGTSLNCAFKKIEKTGTTNYRVTSECSDGGAAWGREDSVETTTNVYEIPNETSFTVTYEGGSTNTARYCAQVPD